MIQATRRESAAKLPRCDPRDHAKQMKHAVNTEQSNAKQCPKSTFSGRRGTERADYDDVQKRGGSSTSRSQARLADDILVGV